MLTENQREMMDPISRLAYLEQHGAEVYEAGKYEREIKTNCGGKAKNAALDRVLSRFSLSQLKSLASKMKYLNQYQFDTEEARIARGNEPIPGGRFASAKKREMVKEDDWLNAQQEGLYTVRAYWPGRGNTSNQLVHQYDEYLKNWGFRPNHNEENDTWYYEATEMAKTSLDALLDDVKTNNYRIIIKSHEQKWCRGNLYFARFFRYNAKEVNRCAYCGRKVIMGADLTDSESKLEVDHIIPVAKLMNDEKMMDGTSYRDLALTLGIKRADSPLNLVASCHSCNSKKRTITKGYIRRAMIGRHDFVWIIRNVVVGVVTAALILGVWLLIH